MADMEKYEPGMFCWADLSTSDLGAAKKFYGEIFGWAFDDMPNDKGVYSMVKVRGREVGAAFEEKTPGAPPPHWNTYFSVADVDASTKKATALGGKAFMGPFDVFDVGRMSVVQDPTGAVFCIWQPKKHHGARVFMEPNALCWTELSTKDTKAARAFYTGLFDWKTKASDPSNPEAYTEWHVGERGIGGMMPMPAEAEKMGAPPHWLNYFAVTDCDATAKKAQELGAVLYVPPTDIPKVGRFSVIRDPQGAVFAIIKVIPM
jgi:predicted enzyme related to lactoylglutathione lyase